MRSNSLLVWRPDAKGRAQRGACAARRWRNVVSYYAPTQTPLLAYTLFLLVIELVVHKQGSHDGS